MEYLLKRHQCDLVCVHPSQSRPKWEHILCAQLLPTREVQVPPRREPTILLVQILEQELVLFLNHEPWFFLWSNLGNPNLTGLVTLTQPTAISCIINTVSLSFSGIQVRRAGRFHAVILQEASDHVPHISDQFVAHTGNTDLAILLNKETFEPDPTVLAFRESSTSKGTWGMVLLIVRALLRCSSLAGTSTVTFCSVHIPKKRDASTDLLQRLHGYFKQHNVDFIGGDFNRVPYSQFVTCSRIQIFSAPGLSSVWIHMAATSLTMQRLASDFVINPLTSLCSYISAPLICLAPLASCAANMHNKEEWNAGITNITVREGDEHDCDPVRQGQVSAFPFTPSAVARESSASQLCLPTALTLGRFAASLCLCFCLCLCLCMWVQQVNTSYAFALCLNKRLETFTGRSCPSGPALSNATSTLRCFFYPSSMVDLVWDLRFNATRLLHGVRGSRSSPR